MAHLEVVILIQARPANANNADDVRLNHCSTGFLSSDWLGIWVPNIVGFPPARLLAEVFAKRDFGLVHVENH